MAQYRKQYTFEVNVTEEPVLDPNVFGETEDLMVEHDWTSLDTLKNHLGFIREDSRRETLKVTLAIGNDEDGVVECGYAYVMQNGKLGDGGVDGYKGYGEGRFDNGHDIPKTIQTLFETMKEGKAFAGDYFPNGKLVGS